MPTSKPRLPLSGDRVVEAALDLVDREGLDALSMRRLGTALRVEAMSLYKHVPNKAALVDLVAGRVLADVAAPRAGLAWEPRLRHVAGELRRVALAHPHVFPVIATRMPSSPRSFAPLETLLGALQEAGLGDDEVLRHFWTFVAWVTGALLAETAALSGHGSAALVVPDALDPAEFPNLARLGAALSSCDFESEFANGLAVLVAAVRSAAAARHADLPRDTAPPQADVAGAARKGAHATVSPTRRARRRATPVPSPGR